MQAPVHPAEARAQDGGSDAKAHQRKEKPPLADLQRVQRGPQRTGADGFGQKRGACGKGRGRQGQRGGKNGVGGGDNRRLHGPVMKRRRWARKPCLWRGFKAESEHSEMRENHKNCAK